jgi:type VI secretion system secreted protein Hcp
MANFYVTIENSKGTQIKGDCQQDGREDTVQGYEFRSGAFIPTDQHQARPNGVRIHRPVSFRKRADQATPLLWQSMSRGEKLKKVRFDFYQIDEAGSNKNTYSITIENAVITDMETVLQPEGRFSGTEELAEVLSFSFDKITWDHHASSQSASSEWKTA